MSFRSRLLVRSSSVSPSLTFIRTATTSTTSTTSKPSGDISSVFPSLSGTTSAPLPSRFADLKRRLISGHEPQVTASWHRLLATLQRKRDEVKTWGSKIVPEINFHEISDVGKRTTFADDLHRTGVAVLRGVVEEKEALGWKESVKGYIKDNPGTRGFPADNPAVYELYWSPSQVLARAHPNLLKAQTFLMSQWRSADDNALISTSHGVTYADRLRIRPPGDSRFALGPHVDGGSCERWEEDGYGRGRVYDSIFEGNWEKRVFDVSNVPAWLAISEVGGGEGHLMVCPMLEEATAYLLLRPFFRPTKASDDPTYLYAENWILEDPVSSVLQGAVPANCQELNSTLHPHLGLEDTMVHIPRVRPGDYVAWHCDIIHAVDKMHTGTSDSSVMYIPACPLTEADAEYLARQREKFAEGAPAPDFPSSEAGETQHRGRLTPDFLMKEISPEAQQAMGLLPFDAEASGILERERRLLRKANQILGFA